MHALPFQSLVFLFPLLHIQADLYSKIEEDPSVSAIYKWVKVWRNFHSVILLIVLVLYRLLVLLYTEVSIPYSVSCR